MSTSITSQGIANEPIYVDHTDAPIARQASISFDGREANQLPQDTRSVFTRILDFLRNIPSINSIISVIEAGWHFIEVRFFSSPHNEGAVAERSNAHDSQYAQSLNAGIEEQHIALSEPPQDILPMLDAEYITQGNRKWSSFFFLEDTIANKEHVTHPLSIIEVPEALQKILGNLDKVSPVCIPLHVGAHGGGHWVTLIIHKDYDNRKCVTLFNSKGKRLQGQGLEGEENTRNELVKEKLDKILHGYGVQPLKVLGIDLQDHLKNGCGEFTVAAIDALMTAYKVKGKDEGKVKDEDEVKGKDEGKDEDRVPENPRPVKEILIEFARDFVKKTADEQYQWAREWRKKMKPE